MTTYYLKPRDQESLHQLKDYIEQNLNADLAISRLTKQAGMNADKLKAGFKQLFQQTIHRFIIQKRMEKAVEILRLTDNPINTIASDVGYSERNFYTVFKATYSKTPQQVRNQTTQGDSPF